MIVTSRGLLFGGKIRAGDAVAVIVGGDGVEIDTDDHRVVVARAEGVRREPLP